MGILVGELKLPPWSYSSLSTFEQCPRKFYHRYILKEKEPETEALRKGNEVHKALELRLKENKNLPAPLDKYEPIARAIQNSSQGQVITELKLGLDNKLNHCDFFGPNVWGRGAADIVVKHKDLIWLGDYKTGKKREKGTQLGILAMFLFKAFPDVKKIVACNIWLEQNEIGIPYVFYKENEAIMWADLLPRIKAMEDAFIKNSWPEQPSPLCKWCAVKICPNNRS